MARQPYPIYRDNNILAHANLRFPGSSVDIGAGIRLANTAKTFEDAERARMKLWREWIGFQREEGLLTVAKQMSELRRRWLKT